MSNIAIAIATIQDIEGMIAVRDETWLDTYPNQEYGITVEDLKAKLEERHKGEAERWGIRMTSDSSNRTWVAKDGNRTVAFISVQKLKDENKLWALYVLSEFQNRSIGTQLMEKALKWLGMNKKIILEVVAYNRNAINFYTTHGFVKKGKTNNPVGNLPSGKQMPEILMVKYPRNSSPRIHERAKIAS